MLLGMPTVLIRLTFSPNIIFSHELITHVDYNHFSPPFSLFIFTPNIAALRFSLLQHCTTVFATYNPTVISEEK